MAAARRGGCIRGALTKFVDTSEEAGAKMGRFLALGREHEQRVQDAVCGSEGGRCGLTNPSVHLKFARENHVMVILRYAFSG